MEDWTREAAGYDTVCLLFRKKFIKKRVLFPGQPIRTSINTQFLIYGWERGEGGRGMGHGAVAVAEAVTGRVCFPKHQKRNKKNILQNINFGQVQGQ